MFIYLIKLYSFKKVILKLFFCYLDKVKGNKVGTKLCHPLINVIFM